MARTVVVGVDESPSAAAALDWAFQEASVRRARVDAVHVAGLSHPLHRWLRSPGRPVGQADLPGGAAQRCEELKKRFGVDFSIREVSAGAGRISPAPALIEVSRDADLLVLGAVGSSRAREQVLGSTALRCAARSSCPVLITRQAAESSGPPAPPRRIVVALDDSPAGREALSWGLAEARLHSAGLQVLHVVWPPEWPGRSEAEIVDAARLMVEYAMETAGAQGRATAEVVTPQASHRMDPGSVIVDRSGESDLVVCGTLGFGSGRDFAEIMDDATAGSGLGAGAESAEGAPGGELGPVATHLLLRHPSRVAVVHAPPESRSEMEVRFLREQAWTEARTAEGPADRQ